MADTSSPALAEKTIVDEIKEHTPKCWRDLYHLLDLYASVPEAKTIHKSRLSVIDEEPEKLSQTHSLPKLNELHPPTARKTSVFGKQTSTAAPRTFNRTYTGSTFTQSKFYIIVRVSSVAKLFSISGIFFGDRIPLIIFGMAKIKRIRISAMLSGLKLEADLQNVHASVTHRERIKGNFYSIAFQSWFMIVALNSERAMGSTWLLGLRRLIIFFSTLRKSLFFQK
jgi:hypothetical protein